MYKRQVSGSCDQAGRVFIPTPQKSEGVIGEQGILDPSEHKLEVIIDKKLLDYVSIEFLPSKNNISGILVDYQGMKGTTFNVTLSYWTRINYWEERDSLGIYIFPYALRGKEYNETHDIWVQEFLIVNNGAQMVNFYELKYDRLDCEEAVKESITISWNNLEIKEPNFHLIRPANIIKLPVWCTLYSPNEKANLTLSFLSTNKFPRR